MPSLNSVLSCCSALALLGISSVFGFMDMPTAMGLSILAGALGLAFSNIENIAEFSGAGFSAKMKNEIQAVIDKETEQEVLEGGETFEPASDPEINVIQSLQNQKYTWRTLRGISKDAQLEESEAWTTLLILVHKELARTANKNNTGETIWSLTQEGRAYANKIA